MTLLNLSKIKKAFGTDLLFEEVSFQIEENDKIGLVGVNGAGKTTLFKILLKETSVDDGDIFQNKHTRFGYMQQQTNISSDKTVYEEVMTVFEPLLLLEEKLKQIADDIQNKQGDMEQLIVQQHALSEEYQEKGGFLYKNLAKASLMGLGFSERDLSLPFHALSGGQMTRVYLCRILLSDANLLLLDEPTNHLDIASVEWLEGFLKDYRGAFIVISHDRYFLDRVTNKTFELENQKLTVYNGGYSTYLKQKEENRKALERNYENTQREIHRIEGIIEQQKRWNRERNIKTAESKQKMIDRLKADLVAPENAPLGIRFAFPMHVGGGNDVCICENLSMGFGEKHLFRDLNLFIKKAERVFLLGPNGCGKTTLFHLLTEELFPIKGNIRLGANITIGYYDQTQEHLDYQKTVFDEIADSYPQMTQTEIRNALAVFLFKGDDVFKLISTLSGGERAKVSLLKLMLSGANFLLLDEPTNHLDISSREALEDALLQYKGTLFIISHDRYFINKLAQRVCYMTKDGLKNYLGNYDDFIGKYKETQKENEEKPKSTPKNDYKLQKQLEAEKRKRQNAIKRTEGEITNLEQEIESLQEKLSTPEYATDYVKALELTKEIEELEQQLRELYEKWEDLV